MPTLKWIGKATVRNHHREVPYRLLEEHRDLSVDDSHSSNLLVQGDNLQALKALLPYYAGGRNAVAAVACSVCSAKILWLHFLIS